MIINRFINYMTTLSHSLVLSTVGLYTKSFTLYTHDSRRKPIHLRAGATSNAFAARAPIFDHPWRCLLTVFTAHIYYLITSANEVVGIMIIVVSQSDTSVCLSVCWQLMDISNTY